LKLTVALNVEGLAGLSLLGVGFLQAAVFNELSEICIAQCEFKGYVLLDPEAPWIPGSM
jgi:hypothetical protein